MAIKLPSNFDLPAAYNLDHRKDIAQSVNDLRNWDFEFSPIPEGFEVFVDGAWYTYMGQDVEIDAETGYFRERGGVNVLQNTGDSETDVMSQKVVTDNLNSLSDRIQEIIENLGIILEVRSEYIRDSGGEIISGGPGLYEKGTTVTPYFGWKAYYNGIEITPASSSGSNGENAYNIQIYTVSSDGTESLITSGSLTLGTNNDPNLCTWAAPSSMSINTDTIFRVRLSYGTGVGQLNSYLDVKYNFVNYKTWGYITSGSVDVSTVESFLNGTNGKIIGNELSLSRELPITVFDCSGEDSEVYPIYVLPIDVYNSVNGDLRVLVGNIEVSIYDMSNPLSPLYVNRGTEGYIVLLFNVGQRGILNIEIKNYD